MIASLRYRLYQLFVTRPVLFAVLDTAIPFALGVGAGWLIFA